MTLNAVLTPMHTGGFQALNPETQLTTCAATPQEALAALRHLTERFLCDNPSHPIRWSLVTSFELDIDYTPESCPL